MQHVDFADALAMPAPSSRYWVGRNGAVVRFICIHGTAGGTRAQDVAQWLNTNSEHVASVHYLIGQDGTIVQSVAEEDSAWGNGDVQPGHAPWVDTLHPDNPNYWSISIEHCKPHSDNSDALTPAQQSASFRLIKDICRRHNIPLRRADAGGGICAHAEIDPVNRSRCPGPYPWDELFSYLNAQLNAGATNEAPRGDDVYTPGIPAGWSDSNGTLAAPNKSVVQNGFRLEVLKGWDPNNLPLWSAERGANPCDPTDPHSGDGTQQLFQDTLLVWQKATNRIFRVHLGVLVNQLLNQPAPVAKPNPAKTAKVKADLAQVQADVQAAETDVAALDS